MTILSSMAEAIRLTRDGDLTEATSLIRTALGIGDHSIGKSMPVRVQALAAEHATPKAGGSSAKPRPSAAAGSFEPKTYSGHAGSISYMLYRPASVSPGMPLVIMLHGCSQSPEDFARGTAMNTLAEERGFLVAYPRQTQAANAQKCWNWFRPGDQGRDRGEPALIAGLTREIVAAEHADPGRVYVAGLSAGGAAAAIMADAYPDLFAAVGVHSGLACRAASDLPSALAAMKQGGRGSGSQAISTRFVPVITFHGDRDGTVNEVNARQIIATAKAAAGAPLAVKVATGEASGRRYTRTTASGEGGQVLIEQWTIDGAGHAWSGGDPAGSYADAAGPDASRAMVDFFLTHRLG